MTRQIDIKHRIKKAFNSAAQNYDQQEPRFFSYFGVRTAELARIVPGSRVLDVGTGRGAALFPAIEKVGLSGRVIGVDVAEDMVRLTTKEINMRKISNGQVLQMDADHLSFPDNYFDFVLCGFAIFFFPTPHMALREFFRVLRKKGRLIATTSGKPDPRWGWFDSLLEEFCRKETLVNSIPTSALQQLMSEVGFSCVHTLKEDKAFTYTDEEVWWNTYMSHGGVRDIVLQMAEPLRGTFKREAIQRARAMKQEHGLNQDRCVLFTMGTK